MKLLIIGYKRSGKDTLAELFKERFGLTFKSSSEAAARIFIYEALQEKYGYHDFYECYEDRVNHRAEWYEMICEYNKEDKARLAKEILKSSDCYVGMRDKEEIDACKEQELFDLIIWVDAEQRVGKESSDSCNVTKEDADIIIENNGEFFDFLRKGLKLGKAIFNKEPKTLNQKLTEIS